jgi:serine/threonine protein phosphatase PrpC
MEVTELLSQDGTRLFVHQDMAEGALFRIGPGLAAVYSSRCPGKETVNEDAAALIPCGENACVLVVADGVGGGRAGGEASSRAVKALKKAVDKGLQDGVALRGAILDGFDDANRTVLDLGLGAATTLTVVEIEGARMRPYHVGDSPVLVVGQKGKIKLQSIAHSPVGYGLEGGFIDEKEALHHDQRHLVSNVIGTEDMHIEVGPALALGSRDTVIMASDGLVDNLETREIVDCVRKGPLEKAASVLARQAASRMLRSGSDTPSKPDDLTFILFRLHQRHRRAD